MSRYSPRYPRYSGRWFKEKGMTYPMDAISTERLIEEMEKLRKIEKKTLLQLKKLKHYAFIVTWRNRNEGALPPYLRYEPQKWSLSEITEYNYPEGIYELSLLYDLALRQGSLGKVNLLHDILYQKGWVYHPGRFKSPDCFRGEEDDSSDTWEGAWLEPVGMNYSKRDMQILRARKLIK